MFRTEKTVRVLQAVAAIASLAVLLWSLGLPSLRFAEAANLIDVSDTLSDTATSTVSNHTIVFTTPSGVAGGETIVVTFPDGTADFDLSTIDFGDMDLASTSDYTLVDGGAPAINEWGVSTSTFAITLTAGTGAALAANATVTLEIGTNATFGVTGDTQIINPADADSYEMNIAAGSSDTGATRVVILAQVLVTASVDTIFEFSVGGLGGGQTVNGTTTTGTSTATAIPFGTLGSGGANASTSAQLLNVSTNASQGFVVTVQVDQNLQSSTGADIDGFSNGSDTNTPVAWTGPAGTIGSENTYGHWGITSDDATTTRSSQFGSDQWIAISSTTPRIVMSNDGPSLGAGTGVGETRVGFKVEISALQEAGDDYQAVLTYVATPTF
jgi:hypothetical protein